MIFKKKTFFLTLLLLILFIAGCTRIPGCGAENENSGNNAQSENELPEEILEIENTLIEIMNEADLIPLVQIASPQSNENTGDRQPESGSESGNEEQQGENEGNQNVEKTYDNTVLNEVLKKELDNDGNNRQLPKNTEEIWDNIKMNVTRLHNQWDDLEPVLIQENVDQESINSFEESLENLTINASNQNYFSTLTTANESTKYLSKFMMPFTEDSVSTLHEMRYHTRNIVISAADNNYGEAQESLDYMKAQNLVVTSDLEDKEKSKNLDTSLNNLQRALDQQDMGLIHIKASIVMEDLIRIMEELDSMQ